MSDDGTDAPRTRPPRPAELDATVVRQAIFEGLPAAFVLLYRHYEGSVRYAVARAAVKHGRRDDVEALVQEVWCRFLDQDRRILRHYDASRGELGPFMRWVAYQQAFYVLQRQRHKRPLTEGPPLDDDAHADDHPFDFVAALVQSDLFQKILERLDAELGPVDRVLLREHHLGDRSLRDVGHELGLSEDALYKRNERLKKKLQRAAQLLQGRPIRPKPSEHPTPPEPLLALLIFALGAMGVERQSLTATDTMSEGEPPTRAGSD